MINPGQTMTTQRTRLKQLLATAMLTCLGATHALADPDYPNKPVNIIVAYAPGGQGDVFARLVSDKLSTQYKQAVVVDNKPGVSGTVGTRIAAKAKNDGYTLFLGQTGEITVNRVIMKDLGYDPMKELVPVVMIGNAPLIMLAPNDALTTRWPSSSKWHAPSRVNSATARSVRAHPDTFLRWPCHLAPSSTWCMCPTRAWAR